MANCRILLASLAIVASLSMFARGDEPPYVTYNMKLFEQLRSEEHDALHFRDGRILVGEVLDTQVDIVTPYAQMRLPLRRCAWISFTELDLNVEAVVTVDHNRISGYTLGRTVQFREAGSKDAVSIHKEELLFILLRRSANETPGSTWTELPRIFLMNNGDVLTGDVLSEKLELGWEERHEVIAWDQITEVRFWINTKGGNVILWANGLDADGTGGWLTTTTFTVRTTEGIELRDLHYLNFHEIKTCETRPELLAALRLADVPAKADDASATENAEVVENSIGMELRLIPAGEFMMGSPEDEPGHYEDETQHKVTLTRSFYIGVTEVTQAQWKAVMGDNPSFYKCDLYPVDNARIENEIEFCRRLSKSEGRTYRLPTEAEWEYACRAGIEWPFSMGEVLLADRANYGGLYLLTYHTNRSRSTVREQPVIVGSYRPNRWGLYDMHGNVFEDTGDEYVENLGSEPVTDPRHAPEDIKEFRPVVRGGGWASIIWRCRSAYRTSTAGIGLPGGGFRVVMEVDKACEEDSQQKTEAIKP